MSDNLFARMGHTAPPPSHSWIKVLEDHESAELVFSGLKDGLIFLDHDGRVIRVNPVMEKLLGVSDHEAHGRPLDLLTGVPEIFLFIADPSRKRPESFRLKDREFEVEGMEIYGPGGERRGILSRFQDVTEKRMLERQRSDLLSMMTHDLKAPLSAVLGYTDLILDGSLGEVNQEVQESVEAVSRGSHKILAIIDNYLTLSKLDSGLMKPAISPVNIGELAHTVISELAPPGGTFPASLHVGQCVPIVECDHRLLERALTNLLTNAVKFTGPRGSIRVSVARMPADNVVRLAEGLDMPQPEFVEVSVEDDGAGIAKDELPHVFDRYWRGTKAQGVNGTGLGLSIVKLVAESHGGYVRAESEEGRGSRFAILLPVRQPVEN